MVTPRIRPLTVDGRVVHQVGLPFHWGYAGETVGGDANDLTALLADPNVSMHEAKVFACQVDGRPAAAGRPPTPTVPTAAWPTRDPVPETPDVRPAGREVRPWRVSPSSRSSTGRSPPTPTASGPLRPARPRRRPVPPRRAARTPPADRLLHRHDALHRLQGVRGRLQAVEPAPGRRLPLHRQQLRQHRDALRDVLAARHLRRAVPRRGPPSGPTPAPAARRARN